VKAEH
jgi:transposase InsO family protein